MPQQWGVFYVSEADARTHGHDPAAPILGPFDTEREAEYALLSLPSRGDEYDYGYEYTPNPWPEPGEPEHATPLFPPGAGAVLREMLTATPPGQQDGPPWVHTVGPGVDHDCILDPDDPGAGTQMNLYVNWRPEFAGKGYENIFTWAQEAALEEAMHHHAYAGDVELFSTGDTGTAFRFRALMHPYTGEGEG